MASGGATEQNVQASLKWDCPIISCQCQKEDMEDIQFIEPKIAVTLMAAIQSGQRLTGNRHDLI